MCVYNFKNQATILMLTLAWNNHQYRNQLNIYKHEDWAQHETETHIYYWNNNWTVELDHVVLIMGNDRPARNTVKMKTILLQRIYQ